ncbi:Hypothetical protein R9X50_00505400 [Acrodontium crateriforme]|uniref:Uncharacterized protein n=1 Tax=Acrodontium crateriforme TaxID=150365 RepID=A0AAQ3M6F0_9PEZI|nr:Hypothetical protein R9X50_00505400 [Acrodontium crateriforme]
MPMPGSESAAEKAEKGAMQYAYAWGGNSFPPALLATLIAAQHLKPFQFMPMLFPPALLASTYLNLNGYKKDAAGASAAWSAAYLVLARRRKQGFSNKFGVRGVVRGATMALCVANVLGGGLAYVFMKREEHDDE